MSITHELIAPLVPTADFDALTHAVMEFCDCDNGCEMEAVVSVDNELSVFLYEHADVPKWGKFLADLTRPYRTEDVSHFEWDNDLYEEEES